MTLRATGTRIAWSTVVQIGGRAVQWTLAAVVTKLIAGFLAPEAQGQLGMVDEYILFVAVVTNLGIFGNLVRRLSSTPGDAQLFASALAVRIVTAVACYATAWALLAWNVGDPVLVLTGGLLAASLALDLVVEVFIAALQVHYRMGHAVLATILGRAVQFGGVLLFTRLAPSNDPALALPAIAAIQLAATAVAVLPLIRFVRPLIPGAWQVDWHAGWIFLRGGIAFGVVGIVNGLYFRYLPDLLAARALNDAEFATFSLSFRIALILSLFSTFFMYSVLPALRSALDRNEHARAQLLFRAALGISLAGGIAVFLVGSILGPTMLAVLTHAKYVLPAFWYVLPAMLALTAVSYLYDVVLLSLYALEEDRLLLRNELTALMAAGTLFAAGWFAPPPHGGLVLALAGAIVGELTMVALGIRRILVRLRSPHPDAARS